MKGSIPSEISQATALLCSFLGVENSVEQCLS